MATPTMTNWIVTYNDHASAGTVLAVEADVYAAYYAPEGHLVEFKDSNHQVVFAIHAGIVLTIRRAETATQGQATA
jgi:hypothetical protein